FSAVFPESSFMPPGKFSTSSKLLETVSVGSSPTENSNSTSSDQLIDVLSELKAIDIKDAKSDATGKIFKTLSESDNCAFIYNIGAYNSIMQETDKISLLHYWNLHKGLNIHYGNIVTSGKQILAVDGELSYKKNKIIGEFIHIYTNRTRSKINNMFPDQDDEVSVRLHVPLLQVKYSCSRVIEEFIREVKKTLNKSDRKALETLFKTYGQLIAQNVDIGGALMIKLTSCEDEMFSQNIEDLKAHIYWAYDQIMSGKPNVFDQVSFEHFIMKDGNTNMGKQEIRSGKELKAWMENLYEYKSEYIISFNKLVFVFSSLTDEIKQNIRKTLDKFDEKPISFILHMAVSDAIDLNAWISCSQNMIQKINL
ncbi:12561_t:CDS:2, partial [Racocetra fulgida]